MKNYLRLNALIFRLVSLMFACGVCWASESSFQLDQINMNFSTPAYKDAAKSRLISEANWYAERLHLGEQLPIDPNQLAEIRITSPFYAEHAREFGCMQTHLYSYCASLDDKLCYIDRLQANINSALLLSKYSLPIDQMNTNAAYALVCQLLKDADINVDALNANAQVEVAAWKHEDRFVPLYTIRWTEPFETSEPIRGTISDIKTVASVRVFMPDRQIWQMRVDNSEYLGRPSLTVANRDELLLQTTNSHFRKMWLTTQSYKSNALDKILKEVNSFCTTMRLTETLPVTASNLTEVQIETPFFSAAQGYYATIATSNYVYGAQAGNKFSYINRNLRYRDESKYLHNLRITYLTPKRLLNEKAATSLAKSFMKKAGMDIYSLDQDCHINVEYWDLGSQFVPLYDVQWIKGEEQVMANVKVLLPAKQLEELWVRDARYIKRPSLALPSPKNN